MTSTPRPTGHRRVAPWVRVGAVLTLVVGVVAQFIQATDPTFPLLYFTVCSALFAAITLVVAQIRPSSTALDSARGAAAVAVVLSGLIFATVLAPVNNGGPWFAPHDDMWVRTATLLMHGIAPVLVVTDVLLHPLRTSSSTWRTAVVWCLWPAAWALVALPLDVTGVAATPYVFLRIRDAGDVLPVLGAIVGLFGIVALLGAALIAAHRRLHRSRPSLRRPTEAARR